MPQSKKNVNVSMSREVHSKLLDILKKAEEDTKKNTGLEGITYTLGDVINMLIKSYQSKQ